MRSPNQRAIERFVEGRMTPTEQQEFLSFVAADPALQRELLAEQAIANAVRSDLAALPVLAGEPSAKLLATLAASAPEIIATAPAAGLTAGGLGMKIGAAFLGIAGVVTIFFSGAFFQNETPESAHPTVHGAAPAAATKLETQFLPAVRTTLVADLGIAAAAKQRAGIRKTDRATAGIDNREAFSKPERATAAPPRPTRNEPVVFHDDTVRLRVNVEK